MNLILQSHHNSTDMKCYTNKSHELTVTLDLNYTNKVYYIGCKNILKLGFLDNVLINYFTVTHCTIEVIFNVALTNM